MIGEAIKGIKIKAGPVRREHYAYQKLDSCCLLESIEPLTGKRLADVFDRRRKVEFAAHFKRVATRFPEAERITVFLDNLNTHNENSFYEAFSAEEAKKLCDKFEFKYTLPKSSWLKMIVIKFSAVTRLCLDKRIVSKEELEKEVLAIATVFPAARIPTCFAPNPRSAQSGQLRHFIRPNRFAW